MATIKVVVPEAYALDENGAQLSKLTVKYAKTEGDMQPELAAFASKWNAVLCRGCGVDDITGMFGLCRDCGAELKSFATI